MKYIIDENTKTKFNETQALMKEAGVSPVDSSNLRLLKTELNLKFWKIARQWKS